MSALTAVVEAKVCPDCGEMILWVPIMDGHDEACPALDIDPQTDKEKAQALALTYDALDDLNPRAAETARLLRKVK